MCQGTNYQYHRTALAAIHNAIGQLDTARQQLGNDHPSYDLLEEIIRQTYEAERRFPCRYDDLYAAPRR
jgi:hypothetical protein